MPNKFSPLPSREIIMEWLRYDPDTGEFVWLKDPTVTVGQYPNKVAGTKPKVDGRAIFISICGQICAAHRLAWVYMHGPIPEGMEIDHIDCNPNNNAISNLRLATSSQQKMNKRVQSNSRSGLKGAYYHAAHKGKKWRSQIKVGDSLIFLGYFHTAEEAHEAYGKAAREHFGEFARAS
jgi:hypothetical protein